MFKRLAASSGIALATLALTLVVSAAGAPAAVHSEFDALMPVKFGLPNVKEGTEYSFSIAHAATGGVKPYHCAPAAPFGPVWAWLHVSSSCLLSGKAPMLDPGTTRRVTDLRFKLTDSETPPKTVELYPMHIEVFSKSSEYPFDGTWSYTLTLKQHIACPGGAPPNDLTKTTTGKLTVVDGELGGHKLDVSITGTTATYTQHVALSGISLLIRYEFSVVGAVGSVRGTETGSGTLPGSGCVVTENGVASGSRVSK